MSASVKQVLFFVVAILSIVGIGVLDKEIQNIVGYFAIGWLVADIGNMLFPRTN